MTGYPPAGAGSFPYPAGSMTSTVPVTPDAGPGTCARNTRPS